jgi:hypothetical protein
VLLARPSAFFNHGRRSQIAEVQVGETVAENLAIVAEANAKNPRFAPESAFRSLHRFGDLCDWRSSFRMRFEFLNVLF